MMYVWFKKESMGKKLFHFYNELPKSPVSSDCKVCNLNKAAWAIAKQAFYIPGCLQLGSLVSVSDARVIQREVVCGSLRSFLQFHFTTVALENVSNEQTHLAVPYTAQVICL